jgi:hypothetical protein
VKKMEQPEILLAAFALSGLGFFLSPLMMTVPKIEIARWGAILRNDSIISMIAIGTVSSVQLLLEFVQKIIAESAGSSLTTPSLAFAAIMGQLIAIDSALVAIVGIVSALPTFQGFSIMLGHMLGPSISAVTGAIILWTAIQSLSNVMPALFLTLFSIGLCLWSIPFRLGREVGSFIASLAMVFFLALPLTAPIALWVEGYVLTSSDLNDLSGIADKISTNLQNPNFLTNLLIANLADLLARVLAGIVIALIVFPMVFLGFLGFITRSVAVLIGGSAKTLFLR